MAYVSAVLLYVKLAVMSSVLLGLHFDCEAVVFTMCPPPLVEGLRRERGSRRPERLCGKGWYGVMVYSVRVAAEGLGLRRGYCRGGEADGAVLQLGQPRAGVAAKGGLRCGGDCDAGVAARGRRSRGAVRLE